MKKPIKVRVVRKKPSEAAKTSSGPAYVPSAMPKSSTPAPVPPDFVPPELAPKSAAPKKLKVKIPDERRAAIIKNRREIEADIHKSVFGRLEQIDINDSITKALGLQDITGEIYDAILENRYEEFMAGVINSVGTTIARLRNMRLNAKDNGGYIINGPDYITIDQIDHAIDSLKAWESRAKNRLGTTRR